MTAVLIFIAIILLAILSVMLYKDSTEYHVVSYKLSDSRIKKDKITIVFISDLHNKQYGNMNSEVRNTIDEINPDYIIFGGDMITSCMEKWKDYSETIAFIKELTKKYPVFYGIGNHEDRLRRLPEKFPKNAYEDLCKALAEAGCPILDDQVVEVEDAGIVIYGLNLEHMYYRKAITRKLPPSYISDKFGDIDNSRFSILLAHNPEHFLSYAESGISLVLSGHVHGGIIRLPFLGGVISPALKLFPKYDGGLFEEGNSKMILSRGLGTHTVPIRFNNKAEIIKIEINKTNN